MKKITLPQLHSKQSPLKMPRVPGRSILAGLCLVLFMTAIACKLQANSSGASKNPGSDVLLQFLRYAPDTAENRKWTSFGDAAAWHASWNVPRISSLEELNALAETPHSDWLFIMPFQTTPPDSLDINYLLAYSLKATYGFDIFDMNRYLYAGSPPKTVTVVEFRNDRQQIVDALTAKGYSSQDFGSGWFLYSLNEDYGLNMQSKIHTEQMGNLNRILLSDHVMITGKATEVVQAALDAFNRKSASLADDPAYIASVQALQDPSLKDAGELVGSIWVNGREFHTNPLLSPQVTEEQAKALMDRYGLNSDLPAFTLATFATRHNLSQKTTSLILALIFPKGVDANAAAQVLQDRLVKADSMLAKKPFLEVIGAADEKVYALNTDGLPVILAVLHLEDPGPNAVNSSGQPVTRVGSWLKFIETRDLMFLYVR